MTKDLEGTPQSFYITFLFVLQNGQKKEVGADCLLSACAPQKVTAMVVELEPHFLYAWPS